MRLFRMQHPGWDTEHTRSQVCICGRSFVQSSAFSKHKRSCSLSQKQLSGALEQAKRLWVGKKRRKLNIDDHSTDEPTLAGLIQKPSTDPVEVCNLF